MAEATFENLSDPSESSTATKAATATVLSRNDDPFTIALRNDDRTLSLDELVNLSRASPPSHGISSTLGTLTTAVFSSQRESSVTKPTSAGTGGTTYRNDGYAGKGKSKAEKTYASSLSATHGSSSEADAEQDNALVGVGDQFESNTLRGTARARKRGRAKKPLKAKKLSPVIHYDAPVHVSSEEEIVPVEQVPRRLSKETKYLRPRKVRKAHLAIADEERVPPTHEHIDAQPFSRARRNVVVGLCVFIALTFALSIFAARYTGKDRLACTKGIIFSATVLISFSTVLVMVLARRALQEALLAGLLEFVIGFALVIEIHDFMEHMP